MALPSIPQMPPQSTPPLDDRGGDTALPPLLARIWWMLLNSLRDGLAAIVASLQDVLASLSLLNGNLTHVGAIPKVSAVGALNESAMKDDGSTVTITRTPALSVQPGFTLVSTGTTSKARVFRPAAGDVFNLSMNLLYDGVDFNLDDTGANGVLIKFTPTAFNFYFCAAGANPATARVITTAQIASAAINTTGAYQVSGAQVVGARLAAVTAPTGGGTSISAPAGGTVIDTQARATIGLIITALSSIGNTVDPVARTAINDIRARLAAGTGHGLTS